MCEVCESLQVALWWSEDMGWAGNRMVDPSLCTCLSSQQSLSELDYWWGSESIEEPRNAQNLIPSYIIRIVYLKFSNEISILIISNNMIHPLVKNIQESFVDHQPRSFERQAKRSFVSAVVSLKVVLEQSSELIFVIDVGA